MREIKYLSPTSVKQFYSNRDEFYLQRLANNRPPRMPQTQPMSIGSAFDAYVKSYLHEKLFGRKDPEFDLKNLLEQQVSEPHRVWATEHGQYVFNKYKECGALADLMIELELATHEPRFEFTVEDRVPHESVVGGIPLLGKPDIYMITKNGDHVIYDWKVNGYCGKRMTSPKKGYIKCRDTWPADVYKNSRNNGDPHKDAQLLSIGGIMINAAMHFEHVDTDWANQLSTYAWVLGEEIGSPFIIGIEQLTARPIGTHYPLIRVATHRGRVSEEYQRVFIAQIAHVWNSVQSGHIFTDLSREESDDRCNKLDDVHNAFVVSDDPNEQWYNKMMGR